MSQQSQLCQSKAWDYFYLPWEMEIWTDITEIEQVSRIAWSLSKIINCVVLHKNSAIYIISRL